MFETIVVLTLYVYSEHSTGKVFLALLYHISELKQVAFLTTRTSTGSKVDVFHQSQPLTQSSDVTHAVRVVKNVTCLSSLLYNANSLKIPLNSVSFVSLI
jgi:hypothetical protein